MKQTVKWEPYFERLSSVSISVMVKNNIIGHVKAFTHAKVVEQWWLLGNITHVHNCNIWNERSGKEEKMLKNNNLKPNFILTRDLKQILKLHTHAGQTKSTFSNKDHARMRKVNFTLHIKGKSHSWNYHSVTVTGRLSLPILLELLKSQHHKCLR